MKVPYEYPPCPPRRVPPCPQRYALNFTFVEAVYVNEVEVFESKIRLPSVPKSWNDPPPPCPSSTPPTPLEVEP